MMTNILDTYRWIIQQYGTEYSGIYLTLLLVLFVWSIYNRKSRKKNIDIYCIRYFLTVVIISTILMLLDIEGFIGLFDFYMIIPNVILIIVLYLYLGKQMRLKKLTIMITFSVMILVEASVPFDVSLGDSFGIPGRYGKYSEESKDVVEIIGDDSVTLPRSLEAEYRSLNWIGSIPNQVVYEDNEDYVSNLYVSEAFKIAVQNETNYVVIRVADLLGEKNEEGIDYIASGQGYIFEDVVGEYRVYKKG